MATVKRAIASQIIEEDDDDEDEEPGEVIESAPPLKVGEEREINSSSLKKKLLNRGFGWETPELGDEVTVRCVGILPDGTKISSFEDKDAPCTFKLGHGLVKELDSGIVTMKKGEIALFTLPPDSDTTGFGASGGNGVSQNSVVQFEVELVSWISIVDVCKDGGIIKKILRKGERGRQPSDLDEVLARIMASPAKSRRGTKSFSWTLEARVALLEICADYQHTHGNSHTFKWPQILPLFNQRVGATLQSRQLSNKMDGQKREYNLWKDLRHKETGLGYNADTGQILAPPQWWEHKVKENAIFKKFRSEGVPPVIEDLWVRLFEGTVATGEDISIPGMQSSSARTGRGSQSQPVGHAEDESPVETYLGEDDDEEPLLHRPTSPVREHIGRNYGSPPPVLTPPGSGRGRDEFSPSAGGGPSLPPRGSAPSDKRKSSGSKADATTSLGHIGEMAKRYCTQWDKEAQMNASVTSPEKRANVQCSVRDAMQKLYDMCDLGLLERNSDFFYSAAVWMVEEPKRQLFMSFEDDEGRLGLLMRVLGNP